MADAGLLLVVAAAVLACTVLLSAACLRCRNKGPLVSIRQTDSSGESTAFRIIHASQPTGDRNSVHHSSNLLSPFSPSFDVGTQRRQRSFTTDTESNPSYENPADGSVYVNGDSDVDDPGYIFVLPGDRTPTPSSDVPHDYENVQEKKDAVLADKPSSRRSSANLSADGDEDYLNVEPDAVLADKPSSRRSSANLSADGDEETSDSGSDSDDGEGNYVNINETQTK